MCVFKKIVNISFCLCLFVVSSVFAVAPSITDIQVASTPSGGSGTFYDNGETIALNVKFDQIVNITGTPVLQVRIRDLLYDFNYTSGTGSDTLAFSYTVSGNTNDWDGIIAEKIKLNTGNDIQNVALESIGSNENFTDKIFANIFVDAETPLWEKIEYNTTDGVVAGDTRYLRQGDKISTTSYLKNDDTRKTVSMIINVGGNTETLTYTGSNTNGEELKASKTTGVSFLENKNGLVSISNPVWIDQADKTASGTPTIILNDTNATVTKYVVDNTLPVITFADDVSNSVSTSDTINITITELNPNTATYKYGFSSDNICNETDSYENSFTSGTNFNITNETNNGKYICVRATDLAGNTAYKSSTNVLNIDITRPVFDSVSVTSNNTYNSAYAKTDSTLTFTLTLSSPDSYAGNGKIDFTIGGVAKSANFSQATSETKISSYTATSTLSGENGNIQITGITFSDRVNQTIDLSSFTINQAPTPTVIVDTQAPTLTSATFTSNGNAGSVANHSWARAGQTVTYTLNFSETIIRENLTSPSVANNITNLTKEFNRSTYGNSDTIIFTAQTGDNGIVTLSNANFRIVDVAGNVSTILHTDINSKFTNTISTDTTIPTISNTTILSNNALNTVLAKTNDTIKITTDTADNLSPTVTLKNATILNKTVTTDNLSGAVGTGKNFARFTDGTETSEVIVPFSFKISDEAGNYSAAKTSIDSGTNVQFDRTNPIIQNAEISAVSADLSAYTGDIPTYYAKQGDTLNFKFETCDYVDVSNPTPAGTLFGQTITMTDGGLTTTNCTTPQGNTGKWHLWSTTLTNIDGAEGTIIFDILIKDNAGNGDVHLAGTTNNSRVIFDKTRPTNPTTILDKKGVATTSLKHRINAEYTWSGDTDPNTSSADKVSGIWKYRLKLTNQKDGISNSHRIDDTVAFSKNWNATISQQSPWVGQRIPARKENEKYEVRMMTIDKAGNYSHGTHSTPDWNQIVYSQPYSIGVYGVVKNEKGNALKDATVQVVARYNELCQTGQTVCSTITNNVGEYSIVLKTIPTGNKNYNITFYKPNLYLEKNDFYVLKDDIATDKEINATMQYLQSVHDWQTFDQTITIQTDLKFFVGTQEFHTQLYVNSLSGEITVKNIQENNETKIQITSLSEITNITSNNPNIIIENAGNNFWYVRQAGNYILTKSTGSNYIGGQSKIYNSGSSRIGVIHVPANGKSSHSGDLLSDLIQRNKIMTPTESLADIAKINAGTKGKVLTRISDFGEKIFLGYQSGRLPMSKFPQKINSFIFRGTGSFNYFKKFIASQNLSVAKLQINKQNSREKSNREVMTGVRRLKPQDVAKTIISRRKFREISNQKLTRYEKNLILYNERQKEKNNIKNLTDEEKVIFFRGQKINVNKFIN